VAFKSFVVALTEAPDMTASERARAGAQKSKGSLSATGKGKRDLPITRFAHPFFTDVEPDKRRPFHGARRMTDHIKEKLEKIPPVSGQSVMTLTDVIGNEGANAITKEGQIVFQTFGDSGHENGRVQQLVADAAAEDFDVSHPEKSPAFLLHLGDVIYYDNTDRGYHAQFYVPYKTYPGKIVAIPGNHDGELFKFSGKPTGQSTTLEAFQQNFCQAGDKANITSGTILRHMVSQPGVYWRLNAPFVDIVGLYSNIAENPGYIQSPDVGTAQKKWLDKTLATIRTERDKGPRKALILAVHHPPFSSGSHGSSEEMLADIDDSFKRAKIAPDMVLAAHSHDYQRYTRFVPFAGKTLETPYLVVGSGGRGLSPKLAAAKGQKMGDHRYDNALLGYGYLNVTISPAQIACQFMQVDEQTGRRSEFEQFSLDLKSNRLLI
jgi:hypothetical protein